MKDFFTEIKINFTKNTWRTILKIALASYAYIAIAEVANVSEQYNFFALIGYFLILYLFIKYKVNIKYRKLSIVIGIILAISLAVGGQVNTYIEQGAMQIFTLHSLLKTLIIFGGLFVFFYHFLNLVFSNVKKVSLKTSTARLHPNKIFFFSWLLIFVLWLPYLLSTFPGIMTPDTHLQVSYIETGTLANNHPFIQTWFEGAFYNLGKLIFHNNTWALGFYTVCQMLILSAIFAYAVRFLYKHKFNIYIILGVLLAYALLPNYAIYSVTIWKDILFGGAFVLLLISLVELSLADKLTKSNVILFVISCLIILFFRNNGIYILLVCTPFILYGLKKHLKSFIIILLGIFTFYFILTGPIYSAIGVAKTRSAEAYSIPLQQVGRTIAARGNIDQESEKYLKELFDYDKVQKEYLAYISDPVKGSVNIEFLDEDKAKFVKVWGKLLISNPRIYIEAYLSQTLGYWFPGVTYWAVGTTYSVPDYGITNTVLLPDGFKKVVDYTVSHKAPWAYVCWCVGLGFVTLLMIIAICIVKKVNRHHYLLWFSPFFGLWLTMMIASPVFSEYRYVYGLFACLPVIIFLPFIGDKIREKKSLK